MLEVASVYAAGSPDADVAHRELCDTGVLEIGEIPAHRGTDSLDAVAQRRLEEAAVVVPPCLDAP